MNSKIIVSGTYGSFPSTNAGSLKRKQLIEEFLIIEASPDPICPESEPILPPSRRGSPGSGHYGSKKRKGK